MGAVKRRPPKTRRVQRSAVLVLHKRVSKLERAVFGRKGQIGFSVEAHGDRLEQEWTDDDETPPEVP